MFFIIIRSLPFITSCLFSLSPLFDAIPLTGHGAPLPGCWLAEATLHRRQLLADRLRGGEAQRAAVPGAGLPVLLDACLPWQVGRSEAVGLLRGYG